MKAEPESSLELGLFAHWNEKGIEILWRKYGNSLGACGIWRKDQVISLWMSKLNQILVKTHYKSHNFCWTVFVANILSLVVSDRVSFTLDHTIFFGDCWMFCFNYDSANGCFIFSSIDEVLLCWKLCLVGSRWWLGVWSNVLSWIGGFYKDKSQAIELFNSYHKLRYFGC